jgi:hypothetical protein
MLLAALPTVRRSLFAARGSMPVVRCPTLVSPMVVARFVLFAGRRTPLSKPSNGWPMCRRIGYSGLLAGEAGAVGTIGLLGHIGVILRTAARL